MREIAFWCYRRNFVLNVIDSKATYSKAKGCYTKGNAPIGYPDCTILAHAGVCLFVEAKAPGKRHEVSFEQMSYLIEAISRGFFAVVTDGSNHLDRTLKGYLAAPDPKKYLLQALPQTKDFVQLCRAHPTMSSLIDWTQRP